MPKGLIDRFLDEIFDANWVGRRGEKLTARELNLVKLFGRSGKVPLFSIVAFSERCELKKVTVESSDIHVTKRDRLYATVRDIWDESDDVLDENEVAAVYEKLQRLTHADQALKEQHIEYINEKYKKPVQNMPQKSAMILPVSENSKTPDPLVCPKCGGKLVLRTARQGANSGRKFYGCSNYPKCRYTCNAEDAVKISVAKEKRNEHS